MLSIIDIKSIQNCVEKLDQAGVGKLRSHCNSVLSGYFDTCLSRFPSTHEQDKFELAVEVMARLDFFHDASGAENLDKLREHYIKVYDLNLDTLNFASN